MKTIEELKSVKETEDIMFDMGVELDACVNGFSYLFEKVFGHTTPSPDYTIEYDQIQSMFWLLNDTLYKLAGKFSLLMGEGDNTRIKNEFDQIKTLYAIDTPAAEQK